MDMPDDWDMEFQINRYKETFDRAIAFAANDKAGRTGELRIGRNGAYGCTRSLKTIFWI